MSRWYFVYARTTSINRATRLPNDRVFPYSAKIHPKNFDSDAFIQLHVVWHSTSVFLSCCLWRWCFVSSADWAQENWSCTACWSWCCRFAFPFRVAHRCRSYTLHSYHLRRWVYHLNVLGTLEEWRLYGMLGYLFDPNIFFDTNYILCSSWWETQGIRSFFLEKTLYSEGNKGRESSRIYNLHHSPSEVRLEGQRSLEQRALTGWIHFACSNDGVRRIRRITFLLGWAFETSL